MPNTGHRCMLRTRQKWMLLANHSIFVLLLYLFPAQPLACAVTHNIRQQNSFDQSSSDGSGGASLWACMQSTQPIQQILYAQKKVSLVCSSTCFLSALSLHRIVTASPFDCLCGRCIVVHVPSLHYQRIFLCALVMVHRPFERSQWQRCLPCAYAWMSPQKRPGNMYSYTNIKNNELNVDCQRHV